MEIRQLKINEFEQAIQLATNTFRGQGHTPMGKSFPHVFSKELRQSFGAFDREKLIGFIGLVPATIRIGEAELTVFSIGAVCTHEGYRNRGISTTILKEIYRYIDQAEASLLFVSGDRGMYMRNHCYHFGKATKYTMGKSGVAKDDYAGVIRKGLSTDIFQIDRMRRGKTVRFESSIWEWQVLFEAGGYASIFKAEQALYVASHEDVMEGYAVIGMPTQKSTKQQAIVTEWGGDPRAVYGILLNVLESDLVPEIELTIPWHEKFYEDVYKHSCEERLNGGTIHIVDAGRFINQLKPYLKRKNAALVESLRIETVDEESVTLQYREEPKLTLSLEEFVKLVTQPQEQSLIPELETIFPIPLPNTEGIYFV